MSTHNAEAGRLLEELLRQIEADPYDPRGGIAEELREVLALLRDGYVVPPATKRRQAIRSVRTAARTDGTVCD